MAAANIGSPLKALLRLLTYIIFTLSLMPVQIIARSLNLSAQKNVPLWYHQACCGILGITVETHGRPSTVQPTLFVVNHVSYFDITVLGALIKGCFVAKSEVAKWPLFGWLAKLQRTVFVERRGRRVSAQRDELSVRLEQGDDLILFPEGTSSNGNRVLPFKSALLSVAELHPHDQPLAVQPVSIAYTRLDGVPMGRYLRPFFAWYGDMDMASHMWQAVGLGWVTVAVQFHPPVTIDQFASRKALTEHCYNQVAAGVAAALTGYRGPLPTPQPVAA